MRTVRILCFVSLLFGATLSAQQPGQSEAEMHARQSFDFARQGLLSKAEGEMREAIRLSPRNPLYHSALAGVLSKDDHLSEAKTELESALRLNPPPQARMVIEQRLAQTDLTLGAELARTGRFQEGLAIASDAAARFPQDAKTWQMLGYFQGKLQLNLDAVRSYASAVRLDPASPEADVGLGTSEFAAGMAEQSLQSLEAGVLKFPEDPAHYQALGVVLFRLSESGQDTGSRARQMFEKALCLDKSLPEAHYELGTLALAAGKLTAAKDHFLAAEQSAPQDSRIHFALARLYRKEGQIADSEREMQAFQKTKTDGHQADVARLRSQ